MSVYLNPRCFLQLIELTFPKVGVVGVVGQLFSSTGSGCGTEAQPTVLYQVNNLAFFPVWSLLNIFI